MKQKYHTDHTRMIAVHVRKVRDFTPWLNGEVNVFLKKNSNTQYSIRNNDLKCAFRNSVQEFVYFSPNDTSITLQFSLLSTMKAYNANFMGKW